MSRPWVMRATRELSKRETIRGLRISCCLNAVEDSLGAIDDSGPRTLAGLKARGIDTNWGSARSIIEPITGDSLTFGIILYREAARSRNAVTEARVVTRAWRHVQYYSAS